MAKFIIFKKHYNNFIKVEEMEVFNSFKFLDEINELELPKLSRDEITSRRKYNLNELEVFVDCDCDVLYEIDNTFKVMSYHNPKTFALETLYKEKKISKYDFEKNFFLGLGTSWSPKDINDFKGFIFNCYSFDELKKINPYVYKIYTDTINIGA